MLKDEFIALVGQNVVVDYPFGKEMQQWDMRNFYIDKEGQPKHKRLDMLMDNFIALVRTPHPGEATHG